MKSTDQIVTESIEAVRQAAARRFGGAIVAIAFARYRDAIQEAVRLVVERTLREAGC